jgi:sister-chromatid-cohesion protein PDS5
MTNLYYRTIKQLLERVSSVIVDAEAVSHLVDIVKEALVGGPILHELRLDGDRATERGLKLILLLAFVFPAQFLQVDVISTMLTYLSLKGDSIAPLTLSALAFVGKHKPLGDAFPDLMDALVPICQEFVTNGTPKQAKQAIKCLYANTTASSQDAVFAELLESIKTNMEPEREEKYLTSIVALGHLALNLPDKFPVHVKNLVSRKIVKELLMQDKGEVSIALSTAYKKAPMPSSVGNDTKVHLLRSRQYLPSFL